MKRMIAFFIALLLLIPVASAAVQEFESSDWAREDVTWAMELPLLNRYINFPDDFRGPIGRGDFAQAAAALVAVEFGWDLEGYCMVMGYRDEAMGKGAGYTLYPLDVAKTLGIIKGRGDDRGQSNTYAI